MKYDFETIINRNNKGSSKWDIMKKANPNVPNHIVPLSVADVDIPLAPEIKDGLIEFLNNDVVLGYTNPTDKYYQAVKDWMLNRHDYKIEKDWIVISNGIVPALFDSVAAFTNKNEGVIIFTPVYHPFYQAIETNERQIIKCPLINQDTSYTIDFNKFENLAKNPKNTMLILCNPHNPIGRVWQKEELEKITKICLDNNLIIVSDEIHQDLIMPGFKHYPIATLNDRVADITITCTAPSKSFNLAGLQGSNIIIKNPLLKDKFILQQEKRSFHSLNTIAYEATILAYNRGTDWLEEFKLLINKNYQILVDFISLNLPKVKVYPLQGTYLTWLDFRSYGYNFKDLEKKMINADLYLDEGYIFGQEGEGFERINIACPTSVLLEALERLKTEFA
ncbi:MalY/PatB family protein [Thomasclavelia cocleata]|uniref:MalY/PatB family protein n=1 Tax=Thomasclavelia cocleata TaxID=69824 RepID=UPI002431AA81|nr:pyridoxal phosphate-dependent aminotransferase [Thomasclavelia cocleata]